MTQRALKFKRLLFVVSLLVTKYPSRLQESLVLEEGALFLTEFGRIFSTPTDSLSVFNSFSATFMNLWSGKAKIFYRAISF